MKSLILMSILLSSTSFSKFYIHIEDPKMETVNPGLKCILQKTVVSMNSNELKTEAWLDKEGQHRIRLNYSRTGDNSKMRQLNTAFQTGAKVCLVKGEKESGSDHFGEYDLYTPEQIIIHTPKVAKSDNNNEELLQFNSVIDPLSCMLKAKAVAISSTRSNTQVWLDLKGQHRIELTRRAGDSSKDRQLNSAFQTGATICLVDTKREARIDEFGTHTIYTPDHITIRK